jgi:sporulation protein YlmC with PRC-barrel domain
MMREDEFDVGYRVLDDDLIDSEGRRCGKVDDIELDGEPGRQTTISAILVGPGAFSGRLPAFLARPARRLWGEGMVRVPWDEVEDVTAVVNLKRRASELGLGRGDDATRSLVDWLPGS